MHSFSHCNIVAAASQLPVNGAEKSWVRVPPTGTKLRNHMLLLTDPILTTECHILGQETVKNIQFSLKKFLLKI